MTNLKHKDKLLEQIAQGCKKLPRADIKNIKVTFAIKGTTLTIPAKYEFSLPAALDAIANDLYWDERGNWSEADTVIVEIF